MKISLSTSSAKSWSLSIQKSRIYCYALPCHQRLLLVLQLALLPLPVEKRHPRRPRCRHQSGGPNRRGLQKGYMGDLSMHQVCNCCSTGILAVHLLSIAADAVSSFCLIQEHIQPYQTQDIMENIRSRTEHVLPMPCFYRFLSA